MKYLKLFENFEDIGKINESWFRKPFIKRKCEKYGIKNYTINGDGSIDVDGDVNLFRKGLTKLPIKFGNVSGNFYCNHNKLTTLEGSPKSVGGRFHCQHNKLTTLLGGPQSVSSSFWCNNNRLTTLEGSPRSVGGDFYCVENELKTLDGSPQSVGGDFDCGENELTTLEGGPKSVGGKFWCNDNKILTFEGAPNHVGEYFYCENNPIWDIWDLFKDYSKVELLNDIDAIRDKDLLMDRFNTFLYMIGKDDVVSVEGYNCIN